MQDGTKETITLSREAVKQVLLEMQKQEVRITWLLSRYLDRIQKLTKDMEQTLYETAHPPYQDALMMALMPDSEWATLIDQNQIAVWEAEFETHYTALEQAGKIASA